MEVYIVAFYVQCPISRRWESIQGLIEGKTEAESRVHMVEGLGAMLSILIVSHSGI